MAGSRETGPVDRAEEVVEAQREALRRLVRAFGPMAEEADADRARDALWAVDHWTGVAILRDGEEASRFLALLQLLITKVGGPFVAASHSAALAAVAEAGLDGSREPHLAELLAIVDTLG